MTRPTYAYHHAFSLVEILVVLSILSVLAYVGIFATTAARDRTELRALSNTIMLHLEESKARAVSGSGGTAHGVWFDDNQYVQFSGTTYTPSASDNVVYEVSEEFTLSVSPLSQDEVVFNRITGMVDTAITITVARTDGSGTARTITVGGGGNISQSE